MVLGWQSHERLRFYERHAGLPSGVYYDGRSEPRVRHAAHFGPRML